MPFTLKPPNAFADTASLRRFVVMQVPRTALQSPQTAAQDQARLAAPCPTSSGPIQPCSDTVAAQAPTHSATTTRPKTRRPRQRSECLLAPVRTTPQIAASLARCAASPPLARPHRPDVEPSMASQVPGDTVQTLLATRALGRHPSKTWCANSALTVSTQAWRRSTPACSFLVSLELS